MARALAARRGGEDLGERFVAAREAGRARAVGVNNHCLDQVDRLTPAQVLLRRHVEHGVVVIPEPATPERIRADLEIGASTLTPDEVARVDALSRR